MRRIPLPLVAIAILYLASEAVVLFFQFKVSGLVRIALYSLVLFLAIRGSRGAANLWGFLSILGAAATGYGAVQVARENLVGGLLLAAYAVFFVGSAAYVFKSRSLAQYYEHRADTGAVGNEV